MVRRFLLLALPAFVAAGACRERGASIASAASRAAVDSARADSVARVRQDSINRAQPGYVIDSILPVEEELRRFRKSLGGSPATHLAGGSPSADALVERFIHALAANDTADLVKMVVTGREFADLYYPESPYTRPPYRQSPALAWTLIQNPSTTGLTRLIRRYGGKHLAYVRYACDPAPVHEGRNTRYTTCAVTVQEPGGHLVTKRYFGSILERDGVFKFLSYTNVL
ncbi:MAG TPA: hypothetical protein VE967_16930 [Gemmatimonadaceae bacterium]|nr:hypothetical protein [Gemmatimonadaceae bacterium]